MKAEEKFDPPRDTFKILARVPEDELVFVDMVFKSYEGIAMVTLEEDEPGLIKIDLTPGTYDVVLKVLKDLSKRFSVEIIRDDLKDSPPLN